MDGPVGQMSVLVEVFSKRVFVSAVFVGRKEHLTSRVHVPAQRLHRCYHKEDSEVKLVVAQQKGILNVSEIFIDKYRNRPKLQKRE